MTKGVAEAVRGEGSDGDSDENRYGRTKRDWQLGGGVRGDAGREVTGAVIEDATKAVPETVTETTTTTVD